MTLSLRYTEPEKTSKLLLQIHQQDQDRRSSKTTFWLQSPTLVRDTLDYTEGMNQLYHISKRERCKVDEDQEVNIYASEHISDRLCRTAWIVRNSR